MNLLIILGYFMYVDLHIHSNYSDSTLSVKDIAIKAKKYNVSLISICDHHSVQCYSELKQICKEYGLNYIYGLEINASLENDNSFIHILAYNPDPCNTKLLQLLKNCIEEYNKMSDKLINLLANDNKKVILCEYDNFTYSGRYGGWKAYEFLIELGIINQLQDYFKLLKQYNIEKPEFMLVEQVCSIIKEAGGIPILAHPGNTFPDDKLLGYLNLIYQSGIEGIECYYPRHNHKITDICLEFCHENNLLITGGSDDHGEFMKNNIDVFDGMHNYRLSPNELHLGNLKIH